MVEILYPRTKIFVVSNIDELAAEGSRIFYRSAMKKLRSHENFSDNSIGNFSGHFSVALSGGSTPKPVFEQIARSPDAHSLPWERVHFFWGDERMVPPDHAESNYRMANEAMLKPLKIPFENIHRVRTEIGNASAVADDYARTLAEFFHLNSANQPTVMTPTLDLVFLGIGPDGHTASLFPDGNVPANSNPWVIAPWVEHLQQFRISMTFPMLSRSRQIIFLVSGKSKSEAVRRALADPSGGVPAGKIQPAVEKAGGEVLWLVDREASSSLNLRQRAA